MCCDRLVAADDPEGVGCARSLGAMAAVRTVTNREWQASRFEAARCRPGWGRSRQGRGGEGVGRPTRSPAAAAHQGRRRGRLLRHREAGPSAEETCRATPPLCLRGGHHRSAGLCSALQGPYPPACAGAAPVPMVRAPESGSATPVVSAAWHGAANWPSPEAAAGSRASTTTRASSRPDRPAQCSSRANGLSGESGAGRPRRVSRGRPLPRHHPRSTGLPPADGCSTRPSGPVHGRRGGRVLRSPCRPPQQPIGQLRGSRPTSGRRRPAPRPGSACRTPPAFREARLRRPSAWHRTAPSHLRVWTGGGAHGFDVGGEEPAAGQLVLRELSTDSPSVQRSGLLVSAAV